MSGFLLFFIYCCFICEPVEPLTGPYTMRVHNLTKCEVEEEGNGLVPQVPWFAEMYIRNGKQIGRLNFTLPKNGIARVRMHLTVTLLGKEKRTKVLDFEDSLCSHYIFKVLAETARLGINFKDCSMREGYYSVDNLDTDKLSHIIFPVLVHGSYLGRLVGIIPKGIYFCAKMFFEIKPILKNGS